MAKEVIKLIDIEMSFADKTLFHIDKLIGHIGEVIGIVGNYLLRCTEVNGSEKIFM